MLLQCEDQDLTHSHQNNISAKLIKRFIHWTVSEQYGSYPEGVNCYLFSIHLHITITFGNTRIKITSCLNSEKAMNWKIILKNCIYWKYWLVSSCLMGNIATFHASLHRATETMYHVYIQCLFKLSWQLFSNFKSRQL